MAPSAMISAGFIRRNNIALGGVGRCGSVRRNSPSDGRFNANTGRSSYLIQRHRAKMLVAEDRAWPSIKLSCNVLL